jgi:histidine triad (HIT) family protein
MAQDCIFCRIVAGELPAKIVREDEDTIAFRDIDPKAPTHVLVIPRRHIPSVNALMGSDAELVGRLYLSAREVAQAEGIAESGYRLVVNVGPDAGQSVDHIHLHVLGGRALDWPPG